MQTGHLTRQAALVADVAGQALRAAGRAAPRPAAGSIALGLPPATQLLTGEPAGTATLAILRDGPVRLNDAMQFSRPPYFALVVHLHLVAGIAEGDAALALARRVPEQGDVALQLWRALCLFEAGDTDAVRTSVQRIIAGAGPAGELQAFNSNADLLDAWWYRELVGLHALMNLAIAADEATWFKRATEIVMYHLENTQPDHTTAQPWAVAAFASEPEATIFAEQQLHDAQSQWTFAGPASALIPALLLADAARVLNHLTTRTDR